jgi:hypothetical protein
VKPIRGQSYWDLDRTFVDKENSLVLLCSSCLRGETKSGIIAGQGQTLGTRCHQVNIMKQPTDSNCRTRCRSKEHIKYVVGCTTLPPSEYTNRHDKMAGLHPQEGM